MKVRRSEIISTHALLIIAALLAVYPLASIIVSSLQGGFQNYVTAWTRGSFGSALISSAFVAIVVVAITAIVSSLAGFALATMKVPGGKLITVLLLMGLVLPYEVTVLPLYQMLAGWGLVDTYWALILPQIGLSVPLGIFWMRTFFASVPAELYEAARIDGASRLQTLRLVLLPIAGPAMGSSTMRRVCRRLAPSMRAASYSSTGMEAKKVRIQKIPSGTESPICGRMSAQ